MTACNPLARLRFFSDVVSIELAAGGRGTLAWYRGAGAVRYVGVRLLAAPEITVPAPLDAVRPVEGVVALAGAR